MNRIRIFIAIMSLMLLVPAASFAIFDAGVYGGYNFSKDAIKPGTYDYSIGAIAHGNFTIKVVTIGIGAFYQRNIDKHIDSWGEVFSKHHMRTKDSVGVDAFIQGNIPKFPLHPYGRFSSSIWDEVAGYRMAWNGFTRRTVHDFFKTYWFGGGISIPIIPFAGSDDGFSSAGLNIFVEYLYHYSIVAGDNPSRHALQAGVKIML
jgi:hypothetical protein